MDGWSDGRTSGTCSFDVQLRIYKFYSLFLMDFPGCILAGVSSAGFTGTMADNKSFKQMMRFTKKASARLLREREAWKIGAAWSTGLFCVFLLSALLFSCGGESWDTGLALNFVTSQDQNAPCFYSAHPPRLNTNKVINAEISPSSFHNWKTQEEPTGTFVVVFQLPMFTILHLRPFPLRERCWLGCRSANPTWMWHL